MNNQKQEHNTQNSEKIDTDVSSNLTEMTKEQYINNYANDNEDVLDEEESNDHLPRVQVELDKLNYANESINNLELELEESKKEFIRTWHESDAELTRLEKKLGASCVSKSLPYYESRIELSEAKDKYLKAKIRFETAQELYMAAKNMQVYAEETLEKASDETPSGVDVLTDSDEIKLLQLAKSKVNETEQAKKTSDTDLVEALAHYEAKRDKMNACEKDLKKFIEKSYKYYEFKSSQLKELKFLFTKIEGLKFCLKEAKSTYQQSLKNLESISTEIHVQRKTTSFNKSLLRQANSNRENVVVEESDSNNNTCTNRNLESPSSSTLSSSSSSSLIISETSSHPLADLLLETPTPTTTSTDNENASVKTLNHQQSGSMGSEEDYDLYFLNSKVDTKQENSTCSISAPPLPTPSQFNTSTLPPTTNPSISVPLLSRNSVIRKSSSNSNWISNWTNSNTILSDEDVENLKLDEKLKNYKIDLENSYNNKSGGAKTEIILKKEQPNIVSITQQQQPLNAETLLSNSTSNNNNNNDNDGDETNNGDSTSQTRPQFRVPSFFNNINRK
jgi:hypothetical protein